MGSTTDADGADRSGLADDDSRQDEIAPQACCSSGPRDIAHTKRRGRKALTVLFFLLLLAHVAGNVDPRMLYQADEVLPSGPAIPIFPAYFQGMEFLKPFLAVPGGLAEYLGANVSQYFGITFGGAVILAAVTLISFLAAGRLIALMGGREGSMLRFVPPLLLVVIWNRYTFVLADQMALLAALLLACLYFRLPEKPAARAVVCAAAIIAFYYVAAGPCMLLAAVCGLYELFARRRIIGGVYLVIGGLVPPVMGKWVFGLDIRQAYLKLTGLRGGADIATAAWAGLYGFFIVLTIGLAMRPRLGPPARRVANWLRSILGPHGQGRIRTLGPSAALLVATIVLAMGTLDRDVRTFRRICYYSQAETWGGVILQAREYAAEAPPEMYTGSTCRMLNRALFQEGRLGGEMFAYPQARLGTLLLSPELDQPYKTDSLLKLGAVITAERLALESLKRWGDRPFVLRQLAKIAIVKREMPAARDYLRRLSKDIVHGRFAKQQLAKINSRYDFSNDKEIAQIRSFKLAFDVPGPLATQSILEALVDKSPNNQMAFEYLMAHYLLTGQLEKFASRVDHIKDFGYGHMPRHYAEALILLYGQTRWPFDQLQPGPESIETGGIFMSLLRQYKGDPQGLEKAVALEIPGTYFSYYFKLVRLAQ